MIADILPLFGGLVVLFGGAYWLWRNWRWRQHRHRPAKCPWCCYMDCFEDATFSIHGSSGHFEDITEACADHVGLLLGTPDWLPKNNDHWVVHPI